MDQEMEKRRRQEMAAEADAILSGAVLPEAFKIMRESCYNTIMTSKGDEVEKREDAYLFGRCIDVFEASFKKLIRDGQEVNPPAFELPGLRR